MPTTGPLAEQNIKDRYYGVNDPVAAKMMTRAAEMPTLAPPDDPTITTLYVGGLEEALGVTEQDLQDTFYACVRVLRARVCLCVRGRRQNELSTTVLIIGRLSVQVR